MSRLGAAVLVVALFLAPLNALRPLPALSLVTASDACLVIGFALLAPTLLIRRLTLPVPFAVGALLLVVTVSLASLLSTAPAQSFVYGSRLLAAAVVVPLAFLWWRPSLRWIDALIWAYVLGQMVSTIAARFSGPLDNARYQGLSTHPNFFAESGQIAAVLVPYLVSRTPRGARWLPWACGAVCAYSVFVSGSRASLIVLVVVALLFPFVERSLTAAYAVGCAGVAALLVGGYAVAHASAGSALYRLQGDSTAKTSDALRSELLATARHQFFDRPFAGQGFADALEAHDIYVQVAVAAGIFGLVAFLVLFWPFVRPLFGGGVLSRLGYGPLSYALVGLITASLWDRLAWDALAVCLVAALPAAKEAVPEPPPVRTSAVLAA